MAEESPQIEETPEEAPETVEAAPDDLLAELKAAGVTNTEDLQNKLKASSQVGNMAYKLGETRKANEELLRRLDSIESKVSNPISEDLSTEYGQPLDIQKEIRKGVSTVLEEQQQKAQMAQRQMMESWNTIQSDPDFKLIEPIWNEKLKDPNFVYAVQNGQVNPIIEFQNTKTQYFKGIIRRSAETIEKMQGGGKVSTPVTETGHANAEVAATPEDDVENQKVLESLKDKIEHGGNLTEAEELAALQASFLK